MLFYALIFFIIACIAALAGFNEIAPGLAGVARLIAYAFLGLAAVLFVLGISKR
ncbi:MAG: DUF1328 domain-containing protein [Burkholderiales bacterium]|nr:DUF1328 domain-containing protein [Burkholderiales bacterium]PZM98786.1 MAG: DUF1328 domain-containing protein [Pseudomonadota bacterium]